MRHVQKAKSRGRGPVDQKFLWPLQGDFCPPGPPPGASGASGLTGEAAVPPDAPKKRFRRA
eukprot:4010220-Alexandrium_andersonii.AAC.1